MIAAVILSFSNEQTRNSKLLSRWGAASSCLSCFSLHSPFAVTKVPVPVLLRCKAIRLPSATMRLAAKDIRNARSGR